LSLYSRPLGMLAGCIGMALAIGMLLHASGLWPLTR